MLKILDFYADWCGQCRKMIPIIDEIAEKYKDIIEVEKINAEENKMAANKYGVYSLPCIIGLKDNKEVFKITGMISKNKLIEMIESLKTEYEILKGNYNALVEQNKQLQAELRELKNNKK